MKPEKIQAEIQTNLIAVILSTQAVLPIMLRQKSGHIINISSINGLIATPHNPIYCATKFGVVGFSEALRRKLRGTGILVSTFCPGNTPSEIAPAYKMHLEGNPNAPKLPGLMPTTYVADQLANLIHRPRRMLIIPKSWRPLIALSPHFSGLTDNLLKYFT